MSGLLPIACAEVRRQRVVNEWWSAKARARMNAAARTARRARNRRTGEPCEPYAIVQSAGMRFMRSGWERHGAVYRIVDEPGRCDVRGAVPAGRAGLSWNLYFKLVRWPMPDVKHFDPDAGSGDSGAAVLAPGRRLDWNPGRRGSVRPQPVQPLLHLRQQAGAVRERRCAATSSSARSRCSSVSPRTSEGLPAVEEFFSGLIPARCSGEYARWGCMGSNAHAGF